MELSIKSTYKCKDGRWRAYCVDKYGKPHVVSYPRILMEKNLGRPLKPNEDVHHIDGNVDNNEFCNLQVVLHGEHQRKHSVKYVDTIERCIICGKSFVRATNEWARFYSDFHRNPNRTITCSKSCAGKAGSSKYPKLYAVTDRLQELKAIWEQ